MVIISNNESILNSKAKEHIEPIIKDALVEDSYLDIGQLSMILAGELEELGIVEEGNTAQLEEEIANYTKLFAGTALHSCAS